MSVALPGAQVAQLVEHAIENCSVVGSIPTLGTIFALKSNALIVLGNFDLFPRNLSFCRTEC
jgi:hypothetical protein